LFERSRIFSNRGAILDSVLGLLVIGVLALVISCYLPLYEKVISTVLVMPKRTSHHLATALISFAALSGVLLEVSTKLLWPTDAIPWAKRIPRQGIALSVFVLMLACTGALCTVNTLIYASFYHRQAPAVALAFSSASALMSIVEVVGFYIGINLGFGVIVWLLLGALRVPLATADALVALLQSLIRLISRGVRPPHTIRPAPTKGLRAGPPAHQPERARGMAARNPRPVIRRTANSLKAVLDRKPDNSNEKIRSTNRR
jgi:hypothetical protein